MVGVPSSLYFPGHISSSLVTSILVMDGILLMLCYGPPATIIHKQVRLTGWVSHTEDLEIIGFGTLDDIKPELVAMGSCQIELFTRKRSSTITPCVGQR